MNNMNLIEKAGKVKKFHQFIRVEKGPVNTAVIDLLKGNVYQVSNEIIDKFEAESYEDIAEFMKSALEEELLIEIDSRNWIPSSELTIEANDEDGESEGIRIELHVEEGVELDAVLEKFGCFYTSKIFFYGRNIPENLPARPKIEKKEKNFQKCMELSCVNGSFKRINQSCYYFNKVYNSCWGKRIAITGDGKIRPCIYSEICIGDFDALSIDRLFEKMKEYWEITKDKIEKCKECELRHICFDCREIANRQLGVGLFATNPYCKYDPYKGTWSE